MKKILALLAVTALSLSACGGKEATTTTAAPTTEATTAAPTTEATTAATEAAIIRETTAAAEQFSQDVYITNSTGVAIMELYISSSNDNNWGEDLLNGQDFAADETVLFAPNVTGTADDTWDIQIIDEDGDKVTFSEINLSSATALDLHWGSDGQTPTVDITRSGDEEYFSQDLDITNATGVAIIEMYISPSQEDNWGEDMLGGNIFEADKTLHFSTELVGTASAGWDILIIDEDGDEVTFENINFSSASELTLHWGADGQTPTVDMS